MRVTIVFHHETVEPGHLTWWAESPDVPGFYATREQFAEVKQLSETVLRETLSEQGVDPRAIEFTLAFAEMEEARPA